MDHTGRITPPRRRASRSITLLEVVVAMTFTGIMVLMMLGWVGALFNSSNTVSATNSAATSLSGLTTQLSSDITGAVVCDPNGLGVPFYTFSSNEIGLYEPSSTKGVTNLVLWQYNNGSIQRAVIAPMAGTSCSFDTTSPNWVTIASNVTSASFTPWYEGSSAPLPPTSPSGGSCAGATGSANAPESCYYNSVSLSATVSGSSGISSGSQTLDKSWAVNLSDSALGGPVTPTLNGVPGVPMSVVGTSYADSQSSVSWSAPTSDGGSPIQGYNIQYSSDGGASWTSVVSGTASSPYTVTGLTNGTSYIFEVAAVNGYGTSAWSGPSGPATPSVVPNPPTNLVASGSATGGAQLIWDAPSVTGGAPISSYGVRYSTDGGTTWANYSGTSVTTSIDVTGLSQGNTYIFQVDAINGSGASAWSVSSGPVVSATVPGAPSAVVATSYQNAQSSVSWSAPASTGGAPITLYTVSSSPGGFTCTTTGATSCVVTGLTNGVGYTFSVTATNSVGASVASSPSNVAIPATVPDAPTGVVAVGGNTNATISWSAPANDGGAPITLYTVSSSVGGLSCTTSSSTSCVVNGLSNGTTYTFTVVATNAAGNSLASAPSNAIVPAGAPGAPTNVVGTPGNAQVSLTWSAPANDGGSPITSYTVEYATSPYSNWIIATSSATSTSYVVTGLTNGTAYEFQVAATNATTTGPWSSPSAPVTPATVPGAPTGVGATSNVSDQSTVSWSAPSSNGGATITGYTVRYSPDGGATWVVASSGIAASPYTVTGLTNGTTYEFEVAATNSVGTGPWSAPASATPAGVPGAPTNVFGTSYNNLSSSVSWSAPSGSGSTITGYGIRYSTDGGSTWTSAVVGTNSNPYVVTGLSNGVGYIFEVDATNSVGTGAWSAPSPTAIPATVPGAPTNLVGVAGNSQVSLTWSAPSSDGGAPITLYTVSAFNGGIATGNTCTTSGGLSCTITGLTNGTAYTFSVTATNAAGTSAASALSAPVTPATIPGAPTGLNAVAGPYDATVTWSAPTSNGGAAITSYTVTAADSTNPANGGQTCSVGVVPSSIGVGTGPAGLVTNSNGTYAYVANVSSNTISVINLATSAVSAISVGANPYGLALNQTGTTLYVANEGSNTVSVVNTATNTVTATVPVGANPYSVAVSPNGSFVYVTNLSSGTVSVVNTSTNTVSATITVGSYPYGIGINPTGTYAYVANLGDGTVSVINLATNAITTTVNVGTSPYGVAVTPNGSFVYVANYGGGTVSVINAATYAIAATITVGTSPYLVSFDPSGVYGYVTNAASNNVSVINTTTNTVSSTIAVGTGPWGVDVTPNGSYVYVANYGSNTVSVINTTTGALGGTATSCTVTGLTGGDTYTFTATATNVMGTGPASAPSNAVVIPTPPGAPTNVVAHPGDTIATVTWSAPASNGGEPITSYQVSASDSTTPANGGQICNVTGPAGSVPTSCSFTGLTDGNAYTFTVTATNMIGTGPASAPSVAVYPAHLPTAPTNVTGVAGNSQVSVSWAAANNGGAVITLYSVTASPGGATCTTGGGLSCVVSGLTNATGYTFTVTATNSTGTGPASTPSDVVFPFGPPGAPYGASASAWVQRATVYWNPPSANNGEPVTGYTVTATDVTNSTRGGQTCSPGSSAGTSYISVGSTPFGAATNPNGSQVWVPNYSSNTVSVISTNSNTVIANVAVGSSPYAVAINPQGTYAYVVNYSSNNVSVINTSTYAVVATIGLSYSQPEGIAINPQGTYAYVTSYASAAVGVISLASNTLYTNIGLSYPYGDAIAIDSTGTYGYITDPGYNYVMVFNASSMSNYTNISGFNAPYSISLNPQGTQMWITNEGASTISVINTASPTAIATTVSGLANPWGLSFNSSGSVAYVANYGNNTLAQVNTSTYSVIATTGVGANPMNPGTTPGGGYVYVANRSSNTVSVLNTATGALGVVGTSCTVYGLTPGDVYSFTITATNLGGTGPASGPSNQVTIPTPPSAPTNVVATPGNTQASVTWNAPASNGGLAITGYTVTATDTTNSTRGGQSCSLSSLPTSVGVGAAPYSAATDATTNQVWVPNWSSNTVSVISANTGSVITTIAVGAAPSAIAINPAGTYAYVTNYSSNSVSVINTSTYAVTTTIGLGYGAPYGIAINPQGTYAYVPSDNSTEINVINLSSNSIYTYIGLSYNYGYAIAIDSSGTYGYVTDPSYNVVEIFNASSMSNYSNVGGFNAPYSISRNPQGTQMWISNYGANTISVINTSSPTSGIVATVSSLSGPYGVAFSPSGATAYVAQRSNSSIGLINTSTYTLTAAYSVGSNPNNPSVSSNGAFVWIPNQSNNSVSIFNTTTNSFGGLLTNCTLTGLANGDTYTFSVTASNPAGTGPAGVSNAVVPATIPGAPTGVSASPGGGLANVSWSAPTSNGGAAITLYTVRSYPGGYTCTTSGALSCTVTGLTNGTSYYFTVTATNSVGNGPASGPSNSVIPAVPPGAPTGVSATAGVGTGTVSWSVPSSNGGSPITSYTVTAVDSTNPARGGQTCSPASYPTSIAVGTTPYAAATTPNGSEVWVVNYSSNTVSVISTSSNTVISTIAVGSSPSAIAINPAGTYAYVTNYASNNVSVISISGLSVTTTIGLGYGAPLGIAINPQGTYAYVASNNSSYVNVINLSSNSIYTYIGLSYNYGYAIAIDSSGTYGYVTNLSYNVVEVFNASSMSNYTNLSGFNAPYAVNMNPQGTQMWVSNYGGNSISVINTASPTSGIVATVTGLYGPWGVSFNSTGTMAYSVGYWGSNITPINTSTYTAGQPVSVGANPRDPSFWAGGGLVYVPAQSQALVNVYNTNTGGLGGPMSSCTVTGLTTTDSYTFTVTATNAVGTGAASSPSNSIIPALAPNAPSTPSVTGGYTWGQNGAIGTGNNQWTVLNPGTTSASWTYYGNGLSGSSGAWFQWSSSQIIDVTPGVTYTLSANINATNVTAGNPYVGICYTGVCATGQAYQNPGTNGVVSSTWTAPAGVTQVIIIEDTDAVTVAAGAPLSWSQVSFTAGGANLISDPNLSGALNTISWSAPANNGAPITSYTVTASNGATCVTSNTWCVMGGLSTGTNYNFTVKATNMVGTSPASPASATITPATAPGTPGTPTATAGVGTANVTWSAPSSNGGASITGYTVTAVDSTNPARGGQTCSPASYPSSIAVGATPEASASTPNGSEVWVVNYSSNTVSVISTSSNTVIATIAVGSSPSAIAINPAGTYAYVTNYASNNVSVISISGLSLYTTIGLSYAQPEGIAINPQGTYAYVTSYSNAYVGVINLSNNTLYTNIGLSYPYGYAIAIDASGTYGYITDPGYNYVMVFNASSMSNYTNLSGFNAPYSISRNPQGTQMWITNEGASTISVINTSSPTVIANTISGFSGPWGVTFNASGSNAYVANYANSTVVPVNTSTYALGTSLAVGLNPRNPSLGDGGALVYFPDQSSGIVSVYNISTGTLGGTAMNCTVSGLTTTDSYTFEVYASNSIGQSWNSATSNAITPALAPNAPYSVSAQAGYSWSMGAPIGTANGDWNVLNPGQAGASWAYIGTGSAAGWQWPSSQIIEVTPGTTYTLSGYINATAVTSGAPIFGLYNPAFSIGYLNLGMSPGTAGTVSGTWTAPAGVYQVKLIEDTSNATVNAGAELAWSQPSLTAGGANLISDPTLSHALTTISWAAPANNGSPITSYTVTASPGGATCTSATTSCVIGGLSVGTSYTFTVTATNSIGTSSPSGASGAVTPATAPSSPNAPTAVSSNGGATISWSAPANNGSAITGYSVLATDTTNPGSGGQICVANSLPSSIPVGSYPDGSAATPNGLQDWVTNYVSNTVSVINATTGSVVATISVGSNPEAVAINPAGTFAYVANYGSNSVMVINTSTYAVVTTIGLGYGGPMGIAINPQGTYAYVPSWNYSEINVISLSNNAIYTYIGVSYTTGTKIVIDSSGTYGYVLAQSYNIVMIFNASSFSNYTNVSVGSVPGAIALNPQGSQVWVSNESSNTVSVINTASPTSGVIATISGFSEPYGISFSPNGATAYVADASSYGLSVVNTSNYTISSTASVGGFAWFPATVDGGAFVFVINNSTYSVMPYNTATGSFGGSPTTCTFSSLPVGDVFTFSVRATNAIGDSAYGASSSATTITNNLYAFSSFTFTSPLTGQYGPSLAQVTGQSNYSSQSWTSNSAYLSMPTNGYQLWTVPATGLYSITTVGAGGANDTYGQVGGNGATITATYSLTRGQQLLLLVGQTGTGSNASQAAQYEGGGGGGTFVASGTTPASASLLQAAGGGGGAYDYNNSYPANGINASTSTCGNSGGGGIAGGCNGGSGGYSNTGGSAGYSTNGGNASGLPAYAFTQGGIGGQMQTSWGTYNIWGGFGGGGGGGLAAGGGGGYGGGGGGTWSYPGNGGGGGSYWTGSSVSATIAGNANSNGSITITQLTVPGAPTGVSAVAGSSSAAISWSAPSSNGGSTITQYTATSSPGGFTCTSTSTTCLVSGLTNGVSYTFTVTATNAIGTGPASGASNAVTPSATSTPSAPFNVSAATNGAVSWSAPVSSGGSAITSYTVTSSPGGFTCTSSTTTCTVSGLANGTTYTFTVMATNAYGTGPASAPSNSIVYSASLYAFVVGNYVTFTPDAVTGSTGPTLAQAQAGLSSNASTSWDTNSSFFNVSPTGYQLWTVPATGTYQITAVGATGLANYGAGGYGTSMIGTFSFTAGQIVEIVAGQEGTGGGAGGGGSFVALGPTYTSATPLIVAGGGGGGPANCCGVINPGMPANTSTSGSAGNNPGNSVGAGGVGGSGGGTASSDQNEQSGAGGGFNSSGASSSGSPTGGGFGFVNGGSGGTGSAKNGGFGGGGGGSTGAGGGGGGYSGGGSVGGGSEWGGGGGGASYNSGSSQSNGTIANAGEGYVTITRES